MLRTAFPWIACLAATLVAAPVLAGGVIIDGWNENATMSCEQGCVRRDADDDDDSGQEIYLLAAFVFNGHGATAATTEDGLVEDDLNGDPGADDTEIVVDDPDLPAIIDEIESADLGGCAAAPGGMLGALAGLLLHRRRRS